MNSIYKGVAVVGLALLAAMIYSGMGGATVIQQYFVLPGNSVGGGNSIANNPASPNMAIQFNNSGVFGGSASDIINDSNLTGGATTLLSGIDAFDSLFYYARTLLSPTLIHGTPTHLPTDTTRSSADLYTAPPMISRPDLSISDPSCNTAYQNESAGNLQAVGDTYIFYVYAYYDIKGVNFYDNPCTITATDNGDNRNFQWDLSWSQVPQATGYEIVVLQDNYNSYPSGVYSQTATINFTEYDGSMVSSPSITTPSAYDTPTIISNSGAAVFTGGSSYFASDGSLHLFNNNVQIDNVYQNIFFDLFAIPGGGQGAGLDFQGDGGTPCWQIQGGGADSGAEGYSLYEWNSCQGMTPFVSGNISMRVFNNGNIRLGHLGQSGGEPLANASDTGQSIQLLGDTVIQNYASANEFIFNTSRGDFSSKDNVSGNRIIGSNYIASGKQGITSTNDLIVSTTNGIVTGGSASDSYGSMSGYRMFYPVTITTMNANYVVNGNLIAGNIGNSAFTFQNNNGLKVNIPGNYAVTWGMAINSSSHNDWIAGGIAVNGIAQTNLVTDTGMPSTGNLAPQTVGDGGIISLKSGNIVQFFVKDESSSSVTINVQHAGIELTRVGP